MIRPPDTAIAERLPTTWAGLRFAEPDVEQDYRSWFASSAVAFTRLGMVISLAAWVAALLAIWFVLPDATPRAAAWTFGAIVPLILATLLISRVESWQRWLLPVTALTNAAAGLVGVGGVMAGALEQPEATGLAVVLMFFAVGVFRLHPVQVFLATATYVALAIGIVVDHGAKAELTDTQVAVHLLFLVIVLVIGMLVHVLLSRQLRGVFAQESLIAEQQDVIVQERDRSDSLLLNILPAEIAEELKQDTAIIAEHHDSVTVLFSDIVGFTSISQDMPAADVVALLNDLISRFDRLTIEHGVEKIRTIGDGYMLVGGAPGSRPDHADAVVACGLAMLSATAAFDADNGLDWQVRIGINTGPVVAGVIGERKFAYDLWGDTVNVASRLETTGAPGRLHVSAATLDALVDPLPHEPPVAVPLRNHADVRASWLDPD